MKYLNELLEHLDIENESLLESYSRFTRNMMDRIKWARDSRGRYTNSVLDKIFGQEEKIFVDEHGTEFKKTIPRQRIILGRNKNFVRGQIKNALPREQQSTVDTVEAICAMRGYHILDLANGYCVNYKEIAKKIASETKGDVGFKIPMKTIAQHSKPKGKDIKKKKSEIRSEYKELDTLDRGSPEDSKRIAQIDEEIKNKLSAWVEENTKEIKLSVIDYDKVDKDKILDYAKTNNAKMMDMGDALKKLKIRGIFPSDKEIEQKYGYLGEDGIENMKIYYSGLLDKYEEAFIELKRKGNVYFVLSRSAFDVAAMTTGQTWSSCMNLYTGQFRSYVLKDRGDVESGTLIIFGFKLDDVVDKATAGDDKEHVKKISKLEYDEEPIDSAIGRILIKPFYRYLPKQKQVDETDIIYAAETSSYGDDSMKNDLQHLGVEISKYINTYVLEKKGEDAQYVFNCSALYDDNKTFHKVIKDQYGNNVEGSHKVPFRSGRYSYAFRQDTPDYTRGGERDLEKTLELGEDSGFINSLNELIEFMNKENKGKAIRDFIENDMFKEGYKKNIIKSLTGIDKGEYYGSTLNRAVEILQGLKTGLNNQELLFEIYFLFYAAGLGMPAANLSQLEYTVANMKKIDKRKLMDLSRANSLLDAMYKKYESAGDELKELSGGLVENQKYSDIIAPDGKYLLRYFNKTAGKAAEQYLSIKDSVLYSLLLALCSNVGRGKVTNEILDFYIRNANSEKLQGGKVKNLSDITGISDIYNIPNKSNVAKIYNMDMTLYDLEDRKSDEEVEKHMNYVKDVFEKGNISKFNFDELVVWDRDNMGILLDPTLRKPLFVFNERQIIPLKNKEVFKAIALAVVRNSKRAVCNFVAAPVIYELIYGENMAEEYVKNLTGNPAAFLYYKLKSKKGGKPITVKSKKYKRYLNYLETNIRKAPEDINIYNEKTVKKVNDDKYKIDFRYRRSETLRNVAQRLLDDKQFAEAYLKDWASIIKFDNTLPRYDHSHIPRLHDWKLLEVDFDDMIENKTEEFHLKDADLSKSIIIAIYNLSKSKKQTESIRKYVEKYVKFNKTYGISLLLEHARQLWLKAIIILEVLIHKDRNTCIKILKDNKDNLNQMTNVEDIVKALNEHPEIYEKIDGSILYKMLLHRDVSPREMKVKIKDSEKLYDLARRSIELRDDRRAIIILADLAKDEEIKSRLHKLFYIKDPTVKHSGYSKEDYAYLFKSYKELNMRDELEKLKTNFDIHIKATPLNYLGFFILGVKTNPFVKKNRILYTEYKDVIKRGAKEGLIPLRVITYCIFKRASGAKDNYKEATRMFKNRAIMRDGERFAGPPLKIFMDGVNNDIKTFHHNIPTREEYELLFGNNVSEKLTKLMRKELETYLEKSYMYFWHLLDNYEKILKVDTKQDHRLSIYDSCMAQYWGERREDIIKMFIFLKNERNIKVTPNSFQRELIGIDYINELNKEYMKRVLSIPYVKKNAWATKPQKVEVAFSMNDDILMQISEIPLDVQIKMVKELKRIKNKRGTTLVDAETGRWSSEDLGKYFKSFINVLKMVHKEQISKKMFNELYDNIYKWAFNVNASSELRAGQEVPYTVRALKLTYKIYNSKYWETFKKLDMKRLIDSGTEEITKELATAEDMDSNKFGFIIMMMQENDYVIDNKNIVPILQYLINNRGEMSKIKYYNSLENHNAQHKTNYSRTMKFNMCTPMGYLLLTFLQNKEANAILHADFKKNKKRSILYTVLTRYVQIINRMQLGKNKTYPMSLTALFDRLYSKMDRFNFSRYPSLQGVVDRLPFKPSYLYYYR